MIIVLCLSEIFMAKVAVRNQVICGSQRPLLVKIITIIRLLAGYICQAFTVHLRFILNVL